MEALQNIGFDWQVALANFITFLIIFFILKKYVFGAVGKIIRERNGEIQSGLDNAKNSEETLKAAEAQAEDELKKARNEANQIVAKAKESGDQMLAHAQTEAGLAADKAMADAEKNIAKQKGQMEKDLLAKTAGLVAQGVSKILNEEVDASRNAELNKRAVEVLKETA